MSKEKERKIKRRKGEYHKILFSLLKELYFDKITLLVIKGCVLTMHSKRVNNHSHRGNIIYQTKQISKLIEENKIPQAKLLITELLDEYPHDNVLIYEWSRILSFEGEYAEAYKQVSVLEEHEKYYRFYLTILAILCKDYKAMEYYYYKYFQGACDNNQVLRKNQYQALKIYLQKIFEPTKEIIIESNVTTEQDSYFLRQVANYDSNYAYQHIVNNHLVSTKPNKTIFAPNINIKTLLEELKNLIEEYKGQSHLINLHEVYYFYYPHCGKINGQTDYNLNCLSVSTIYNTSDILSCYPSRDNTLYKPISIPVKTSEETGKELKRVSQIDKFNMRYGKK